jgi:hypothetical protein
MQKFFVGVEQLSSHNRTEGRSFFVQFNNLMLCYYDLPHLKLESKRLSARRVISGFC